jgi:16S rRNA (guanine527-N7)-methyltransferase
MNTARIAELLNPFVHLPVGRAPSAPANEDASIPHPSESASATSQPALSPLQLQQISIYIDILQRWNARISLTAIRDPEEIVTRHFGESLFAARSLFPTASSEAPQTLADVGSGAGFPGLPIKLWAPQLALTLIESNHKKAAFLREVTRALTLTGVDIQTARAETLPAGSFNLVTLRAVEHFGSVLPVAASLLAPAGRLALLIGASQQAEAHRRLPQFVWSEALPIPNSRERIVLTGSSR